MSATNEKRNEIQIVPAVEAAPVEAAPVEATRILEAETETVEFSYTISDSDKDAVSQAEDLDTKGDGVQTSLLLSLVSYLGTLFVQHATQDYKTVKQYFDRPRATGKDVATPITKDGEALIVASIKALGLSDDDQERFRSTASVAVRLKKYAAWKAAFYAENNWAQGSGRKKADDTTAVVPSNIHKAFSLLSCGLACGLSLAQYKTAAALRNDLAIICGKIKRDETLGMLLDKAIAKGDEHGSMLANVVRYMLSDSGSLFVSACHEELFAEEEEESSADMPHASCAN